MTSSSHRVLMLGFDAMDPAIASALADHGYLPAFRDLFRSAARRPIKNPPGLFVGSLWSTFFTGRSAVQTGFHCWEEIVPGGNERRLTTAESIRGQPFWETLSDAGRRVAVLDVPHSRAGAPLRGIQVSEWGCHDRHFGLRTYPPELTQKIIADVGLHPILTSDPSTARPGRTGAHRRSVAPGLREDGSGARRASCPSARGRHRARVVEPRHRPSL
jgi:predicted AlkP superfamily phosphohydrolase/phosphomutase